MDVYGEGSEEFAVCRESLEAEEAECEHGNGAGKMHFGNCEKKLEIWE